MAPNLGVRSLDLDLNLDLDLDLAGPCWPKTLNSELWQVFNCI